MISLSLEPLIRIIGKQLVVALARATRPFRNPGAETVRQMPGRCVRYPAAAAAYPAATSLRNAMNLIPLACAMRARSVTGMPTSPYIVDTEFIFRASMTRWRPSVCLAELCALDIGY